MMYQKHFESILIDETHGFLDMPAPCFSDMRGRRNAEKYMFGLLSKVDRKNGWQLAEALGEESPYALQQFLYRSTWDPARVRDAAGKYIIENIGSQDAVLIVDETGFIKKGKKSAGVARQYSGTAGRIENCQIGVFLTYAAPKGFALIDRELYLPREWTGDPERCREAGIPGSAEFRTKPNQAPAMLKSACEAGMPFSYVAADCVYGDYTAIRRLLENAQKNCVLSVSGKARFWMDGVQRSVSELVNDLAKRGWKRISCGAGTKGRRDFDWIQTGLTNPSGGGRMKSLLFRRSVSKPEKISAYICSCPEGTGIKKLAEVAGTRWKIEQSFQESKNEIGLDQYEVRKYAAWYRHVTFACAAHAVLAVLRARLEEDAGFKAALEAGAQELKKGLK